MVVASPGVFSLKPHPHCFIFRSTLMSRCCAPAVHLNSYILFYFIFLILFICKKQTIHCWLLLGLLTRPSTLETLHLMTRFLPLSTFWLKWIYRAALPFLALLPLFELHVLCFQLFLPRYRSPLSSPSPRQAFVFWRLTHCGALTGSAEHRSPGESSHLFLCLFECSFKDQVLKSCISTDDIECVICFSTKKNAWLWP